MLAGGRDQVAVVGDRLGGGEELQFAVFDEAEFGCLEWNWMRWLMVNGKWRLIMNLRLGLWVQVPVTPL